MEFPNGSVSTGLLLARRQSPRTHEPLGLTDHTREPYLRHLSPREDKTEWARLSLLRENSREAVTQRYKFSDNCSYVTGPEVTRAFTSLYLWYCGTRAQQD
ncbi:hypothetical protein DPEC_G00114010 [Dallia pectoralis]|uniref:Uncharacterized protein n=1 Tax=Dallia pectoralis TaxID=75939 RepID=A0ACC2GU86_DALPE|nr:hypothetical protein DPEC_G00114010 [Dallia pectoralis]